MSVPSRGHPASVKNRLAADVAINGSLTDFMRSLLSSRIGINLQRNGFSLVEYKQRGSDLAILAEFCEQGKLKPIIGQEYPFTEAGVSDAIKALRSRRLRGKAVLVMADVGRRSRLHRLLGK